MDARLAGVSSWGKARALSLEAGLKVGGVCGLGCEKGCEKERRCRCTGAPTFGLPPVFSGPVAVFMACVHAVFDPMILHVGP